MIGLLAIRRLSPPDNKQKAQFNRAGLFVYCAITFSGLVILQLRRLAVEYLVGEEGVAEDGGEYDDYAVQNKHECFRGAGGLPDVQFVGHYIGIKTVSQADKTQ